MKSAFLIAVLYLSTITAKAQMPDTAAQNDTGIFDSTYLAQIDSIMHDYEREEKMKQIETIIEQYNQQALEKELSFSLSGAFPLLRGLIMTGTEHNFIKHQAFFAKKDDVHKWTDYAVGGTPLAATWILKAAGVKSRSKTQRLITANAMALGITFGTSQLLKYTVNETRPDQTDDHSFPSGHATLAFASATIFSREYGYLSPWITVGSYATATGTELLRMQHNRHWLNDLYMGAGIGMVGTNLAYFLTDRIFGRKGVNKPEVRMKDLNRVVHFLNNPSGVSLVAGTEIGKRNINMGDTYIKTGAALTTGFDATWTASPNWSLDLMTRLVEAQTKVFGSDCIYTGDNLRMIHLDLGGRWSAPINLNKRIGFRTFLGVRLNNEISMIEHECRRNTAPSISAVPNTAFILQTQPSTMATENSCPSYSIPSETKFEIGTGMTYECLDNDNYVWGFVFDYYHTFSNIMPNRFSISSIWKVLF